MDEEHEFTFTVKMRKTDAGVVHGVISKMFVDGHQLGCVSSLDVHVTSEKMLPEVRVTFLEGMSPEVVAAISPGIQQAVRTSADRCRQIPFVEVVAPV